MIKIISYCSFALILMGIFSVQSFAQYEVKDSYYFMKDDNEFSDEEKDEEASYIYKVCGQNPMQSTYFDCACIAGAYRQERDKEDLVPQDQLLNSLFENNQRGCTNTASIAGNTYGFCTRYARTFRSRRKNNIQYCECVANKVASDFSKKPRLKTKHIERIRSNAMSYCN